MSSIAVAITKAVTEQIAAANLSQQFTPERSYADWELKLEDNDKLHVDVAFVQTELKAARVTRGGIKYTVPVDIAVRKRFGTQSQDSRNGRIKIEEIDALALLVEEIYELFEMQRPVEFPGAVQTAAAIQVNGSGQHLREYRQFTGIVRITFEATKAI